APGQYSASVAPALKVDASSIETTPVTETFYVGGPRYALSGSESYACYPAPSQIGRFFDTLPHIVFDRPTLPWERTIDGSDPAVAPRDRVPPEDHDPYPWLALILLTDSDFDTEEPAVKGVVPPIFTTTLAELLNPQPASNVIGPRF